MDLTPVQLFEVALDSIEAGHRTPPGGFEQRILSGVLAGPRPARHPGWDGPDDRISSMTAFIATAVEMDDLLGSLAPADWDRTTGVDAVTVRELAVHLVGVERYVLGQLGRRPALDAPRREDHWPVTRLAAAELAAAPPPEIMRTWWQTVMEVIAACAELGPGRDVTYHHLVGTVGGLLLVRTFELWTHGDDIRAAVGRPLQPPDDARMALMVDELTTVLPLGLALCGCAQPGRTARLDLTGPGGGAFDVALAPGDPVGPPDITVATDTVSFCRLASNRLGWDDLDMVVSGDRSLLDPLLAGATAFAAD